MGRYFAGNVILVLWMYNDIQNLIKILQDINGHHVLLWIFLLVRCTTNVLLRTILDWKEIGSFRISSSILKKSVTLCTSASSKYSIRKLFSIPNIYLWIYWMFVTFQIIDFKLILFGKISSLYDIFPWTINNLIINII